MENRNKKDKDTGTASPSSTNDLMLEYIETESGRVWRAKRRAELDEGLAWIGTLLYLDSAKEKKLRFRSLEDDSR